MRKGTIIGIALLGFIVFAGAASAKPKLPDVKPDDEPDDDGDGDGDGGILGELPDNGDAVLGELPRPPGPVAPVPQAPTEQPEVDDLIKSYPTGGHLYQVRSGDMFGGQNSTRSIAYRLLLTEAFLAAKNVGGLDDDDAGAFARKVAKSGSRISQMITIIQCAWINDILYGTWGYGTKSVPGPHGRAIRLLPQHPDNEQRLREGLPLARNIRLRTPANKGDGSGLATDPELRETWELLYMPKLNEEELWNSGGTDLTTKGMTWGDGSSMGNVPHPWVMGLRDAEGVGPFRNFADDIFGDEDWGCD